MCRCIALGYTTSPAENVQGAPLAGSRFTVVIIEDSRARRICLGFSLHYTIKEYLRPIPLVSLHNIDTNQLYIDVSDDPRRPARILTLAVPQCMLM